MKQIKKSTLGFYLPSSLKKNHYTSAKNMRVFFQNVISASLYSVTPKYSSSLILNDLKIYERMLYFDFEICTDIAVFERE